MGGRKRLKFAHELVPAVLDGEKTATWRLWDDKDLSTGDVVDFVDNRTGDIFGSAVLTDVRLSRLGDLSETDKHSHEKFSSDQELYKTYEKYYGRKVTPDTLVKVVVFELQSTD